MFAAGDADRLQQTLTDQIISRALKSLRAYRTLVNNAGVFVSKPFTDYTAEEVAGSLGCGVSGMISVVIHGSSGSDFTMASISALSLARCRPRARP